MADELKITLAVTYANGRLADKIDSATLSVTQTTQGYFGAVVSVGTSEEDLTLGDIGTNGYVYLKNLDGTNYVKYGPKSAGSLVDFGKLKPGESAIFRLMTGVTWRWVANTAACKVLVKAYEE